MSDTQTSKKPAATPATNAAKTVAAKTTATKSPAKPAIAKPVAAKATTATQATAKKVPTSKVVAKPIAAAKPVAASKAVASKPAETKAAAVKKVVAKPTQAKTPVAKAGTPPIKKVKALSNPVAEEKPVKIKLIRDSFTIPENEYAVIADIKKACLTQGIEVKRTEVIRAGLYLLKQLPVKAIADCITSKLPKPKTGRPKKTK